MAPSSKPSPIRKDNSENVVSIKLHQGSYKLVVMGKFEFRTSLDEFGGSSLYSFVFEFTLIHKNEFG